MLYIPKLTLSKSGVVARKRAGPLHNTYNAIQLPLSFTSSLSRCVSPLIGSSGDLVGLHVGYMISHRMFHSHDGVMAIGHDLKYKRVD